MGNLISSSAQREVVIDHDVDSLCPVTKQKIVVSLQDGTVHGHIREDDLDPDQDGCNAWPMQWCGEDVSDDAALAIVERAHDMADIVAEEPDVLDGKWSGPDGGDPLCVLFDTTDTGELADAVEELVESLKELVAGEATLNTASVPAKVFGDLHGQFRDMLKLLYHYGFPSPTGPEFVFNGDWVDRGHHQLETICLVFALKLAFPKSVWLNRGNHEEGPMNSHMGQSGFEHACVSRFGAERGAEIFASFADAYAYLPLGTLLGERILVVHGGIGDGKWDLDHLRHAKRPLEPHALEADPVLYNVLWSDPIEDEQANAFGVHDSPRDNHRNLVKTFGVDVTADFCERNALAMVIRSHEADFGGHGYEVMHDEHLIRVFSARDYCDGKEKNDGAVLSITTSGDSLLVTPQLLPSLTRN